jgi:hypothetical protein
MDDQPFPGRTQLLEAASAGRRLAAGVDLDLVRAEGTRRRTSRRRRHQVAIVAAAAVLTLTAIVVPLTLSGRPARTTSPPTTRRSPVSTTPVGSDGLPIGSPADWLLVAPSGAGGQTNAAPYFDTYNLGTRTEITRSVRLAGLADYPWVAVGSDLVGVADIPATGVSVSWTSAGEAFALAMSDSKLLVLGPAFEVWPAVQPGAVWLENEASRTSTPSACTVHEVTTSGRSLGRIDPIPCGRWIAGAAAGGLLSTPDRQRDGSIQIWDPATGRVVRTLATGVTLVQATSAGEVFWEGASGYNLTGVLTGRTAQVMVPAPKGYLAWGEPVLASSGPLVASLAVTPAMMRTIEPPPDLRGPCCTSYSRSGRGVLEIYNVVTRHVLMTRSVPLSTVAELKWTADDAFVVVNTGETGVAVVPTWSSAAAIRQVTTKRVGLFAENQNDTIVQR